MIGILGGTFDPIHFGHLRIALDALELLNLTQVRFIPVADPVHRERPHASAEQRLAMVRAAIAGESRFIADDRELRRDQPSWTLDTLRSLRREQGDTPLCLLLGGDAFNGFLGWRQPGQIAELAHLVVLQRPGYEVPDEPGLQALIESRYTIDPLRLRQQPGGLIHFLTVTQLDIAASDIRARIGARRSARYLTPDPVLALIEQEGLYRPGSQPSCR